MRLLQLVLVLVFLASCPAYAGTDSAGTSTIGGQEQTDVLTNGGDLNTAGGDLNLSGGDVTNAGAVGATSVTATTVQGDSLRGGTIDNPGGTTVGISGNVNITGQTGATRFKVDDLTPDAAEDATSKYYVDDLDQSMRDTISQTAASQPAASGTLWLCATPSGAISEYTTMQDRVDQLSGQSLFSYQSCMTCCGEWNCYPCACVNYYEYVTCSPQ